MKKRETVPPVSGGAASNPSVVDVNAVLDKNEPVEFVVGLLKQDREVRLGRIRLSGFAEPI